MTCRRLPLLLLLLCCLAPHALHAQSLSLHPVVSGLDLPVWVGAPPDDRSRLFVIERGTARILILKSGVLLATPFLDLSGVAHIPGDPNDERGILGLAFHPNFSANGRVFVHYSAAGSGDTVVERYQLSGNPDVADPGSARLVLTETQPFANHNGGSIAFGPDDGYLYVGLGDGGAAGDPGNRAQNGTTLLGKLLRIDPDVTGSLNYKIPPDNPFTLANDPGDLIRDEIWAFGMRNPYRFSFDPPTGDLYIGDVGQDLFEEIDIENAGSPGGRNYGWRLKEGFQCFNPPAACDPGGLTDPAYEYDHTGGRCAVTGGHVYRGCAVPGIRGRYFFADYCTAEVFSFLFDGASVQDVQDHTAQLDPGPVRQLGTVVSFGTDGRGELYVVDQGTGALDGEVFKIVDGVDLACQDAVLKTRRPRRYSIGGAGLASKRVSMRVQSVDTVSGTPAGAEIELQVTDGTCPPGTVASAPDFGAAQASTPSHVLLAGNKSAAARFDISLDAADFTTVNPKAAPRCALHAEVVAPGAVDGNPSNNAFDLEISVDDRGDVAQATTNETEILSVAPIRQTIRRGQSERRRTVRVKLRNGDIVPSPAVPGHAITLTATDGSCPPGTVEFVDADRALPGIQSSVVVAGGATAIGEVGVLLRSQDYDTPNRRSRVRCAVSVTASGPAGDTETTNNDTTLTIDVLDANDY